MSSRQQTILVPQYMREFTCIGSKCEDTCCAGWKVTIDEETFKKYKKCPDVKMRKKLNRKVIRERSNPTIYNFGKIKMNQDGACPFLDESKMCGIQGSLGEGYLSNTCATYPRIVNKIGEGIESSGTLSCPEIARLALLNPAVIEFDEIIENVQHNRSLSNALDMHQNESFFWELRIFTIEILQNRIYSIAERMVFLGIFLNKLQKEIQENGVEVILKVVGLYRSLFKDKEYLKEQLELIPNRIDFQLTICQELLQARVGGGVRHGRYRECVEATLKGLKYNEELTFEERVDHYKDITNKYFEPFMREHEHIFENYLVNYVFKNMFPHNIPNLFNDYVRMVVHFAMIKLHLIGVAGYYEGLTEERIIEVIQPFARVVEHNTLFLNGILKAFEENELVTMASMAVLIKN